MSTVKPPSASSTFTQPSSFVVQERDPVTDLAALRSPLVNPSMHGQDADDQHRGDADEDEAAQPFFLAATGRAMVAVFDTGSGTDPSMT